MQANQIIKKSQKIFLYDVRHFITTGIFFLLFIFIEIILLIISKADFLIGFIFVLFSLIILGTSFGYHRYNMYYTVKEEGIYYKNSLLSWDNIEVKLDFFGIGTRIEMAPFFILIPLNPDLKQSKYIRKIFQMQIYANRGNKQLLNLVKSGIPCFFANEKSFGVIKKFYTGRIDYKNRRDKNKKIKELYRACEEFNKLGKNCGQ